MGFRFYTGEKRGVGGGLTRGRKGEYIIRRGDMALLKT